jgi:GTP cyclohydrolase II
MSSNLAYQHSAYRAIADLRRGVPVVFRGQSGYAAMVKPAEQVSEDSLREMVNETMAQPYLLITATRARTIGLKPKDNVVACSILLSDRFSPEEILQLIGDLPLQIDPSEMTVLPETEDSVAHVVLMLMRSARLMPAALAAPIADSDPKTLARWASDSGYTLVLENSIKSFEETSASLLREAARAKLPIKAAPDSEIAIFQPKDGGTEHFVLIISGGDKAKTPLVRIHSQCITGDLLGSLKCDCGDQLQMAIQQIADAGGGLVVYLAQEGRDIGLVNKLRAYALQDRGFDTVDANHAIGFETDHRFYLPAATMLKALGHDKIKLLTNNPDKISQIESCGITVTDRIALETTRNPFNEDYMEVKKQKTGHMLE